MLASAMISRTISFWAIVEALSQVAKVAGLSSEKRTIRKIRTAGTPSREPPPESFGAGAVGRAGLSSCCESGMRISGIEGLHQCFGGEGGARQLAVDPAVVEDE